MAQHDSSGVRGRRHAAAILVLASAMALSGCSGSVNQAPETRVAQKFFDLLISGNTGEIRALMAPGAPVTDAALDPAVYASGTGHPVSATARTPEVVDGKKRVRVDYRVAGSQQEHQLVLELSGDQGDPKVSGWDDMALSSHIMLKPGALAVGAQHLPLASSPSVAGIVLLPGTYRLDYVDASGIGTTAGSGSGDGQGVTVTFPRPAGDDSVAPSGFQWVAGALSVRPRMKDDARAAVDAVARKCGATGLVGPECPANLVARARAGGQPIDPASVRWTPKGEPDVKEPYAQWTVSAPYSLTYKTKDGVPTTLETVLFEGTVTRDAGGAVVFAR